jgi:phosphopantetheinyl transferase
VSIFFQHSINGSSSLGIWKIEEHENFFLEKVPLKQQVSHPYKRLQHLAGRYLLPFLYEDFPLEEIMIADTRKPFLHDEKYHFSISHCANYAAAIASNTRRVGVDIELVSPTIEKISPKFLNEHEKEVLADWAHLPRLHVQLTTVMWSAKEAIYKWYGAGQVDFRKHICLTGTRIIMNADETLQLPFIFCKNEAVKINVEVKLFGDLVLAWVVT